MSEAIEHVKKILGKLEADTPNYQVLPLVRQLLAHLTGDESAKKEVAHATVAPVVDTTPEPEVVASEPEVEEILVAKTVKAGEEETPVAIEKEEAPKAEKKTRAATAKPE